MAKEATAEQLGQIRDYMASANPSEWSEIARKLAGGERKIRGVEISDFQAGYICAQCAKLQVEQRGDCPKVVPIVQVFNPGKPQN